MSFYMILLKIGENYFVIIKYVNFLLFLAENKTTSCIKVRNTVITYSVN
jgi:hypothetical protein